MIFGHLLMFLHIKMGVNFFYVKNKGLNNPLILFAYDFRRS